MLRITPIYGSRWDEKGPTPLGNCTLVEYANVKVLINAGGPVISHHDRDSTATTSTAIDETGGIKEDSLNSNLTSTTWENLPPHDCLLLADSTLECMGSLPLYHQHCPNAAPAYATFPTVKMGQMTLYDYHANLCLDGGSPPFSLGDIDTSISQMQTIKYSQAILLPSKEKPLLSITAHRAGHVVGGAFFVLQRLQDETSVVITSTYHIAKELHLDSSTLLKYGATPDVLVTSPGGPAMKLMAQLYATKKLIPPLVTQSQRNLVEHILSVLRRDGNAVLPIDASGRSLELVLLLSQHWERHRLQGTYNLIWLGSMVGNTLDFCRAQLEWMANALGNQFDSPGRGHPYALKPVQFCTSVDQLEALIAQNNNNPTCVLANGLDLDHGPARDLLLKWADNDNNAILFTDTSHCHRRQREQQQQKQQHQQQQQQRASALSAVGTTTTTSTTATSKETLLNTATTAAATAAPVVETTAAAAAADLQDQDNITPAEEEEEDSGKLGRAILESDASEFTTSYQLLQHWCQAKLQDREMEDSVSVDVLVPRRIPLAGAELKQFLDQEEATRLSKKQQEEQAAMLREVELAKGRLRLGEENQPSGTNTSGGGPPPSSSQKGSNKPILLTNPRFKRPKKKSRFDSSLFLKFSKPLHLTFGVREDAVGVGQEDSTAKFGIGESVGNSEILEDDYGIAVIPEHFIDIVTGVDPSKFAGGSGRIGEEVLRRGLGFGNAESAADKKKSTKKKRNAADNDADGEDEETDERGMEATDLSEGKGIIRGRNGRPPTKVMTVPRRLQVFAEIDYIPLEGRVDSRAARQSVRALQPRQVVVLGGPKQDSMGEGNKDEEEDDTETILKTDEVRILAEAAQSFITTNKKVHTPSDLETVELDVGHAAYSVRLIATPYRVREEKEQEEGPPKPIELYEAKLGACSVSLLDYVATGQKVALDGSIVLAPRKLGSGQPSIYVSDGDVLLTDLRTELIAQGMKAEYSTHSGYSQLVVNGKVVVKKDNESGKMDVEGPLCEDFFTVRSVVCGQYVTL